MNPKISIIVPVYNAEKYLHQCVDSLLNQTLNNIEIILINDGSTDNSGSICNQYLEKDNRIKVIHKKNQGPSAARNAGLGIAKGEFVGFVDSDDWIDLEMCTSLVNSANYHGSDIAVCNFFTTGENKENTTHTSNQQKELYTRDEALLELYTNKIFTFSSCNKIYKRELFNGLRYKEGIILEDMDLSYKIIQKATTISHVCKPLYFYRYNADSILRSSFSLNRLDEYTVKKELYTFYLKEYPEISDLVYLDLCNTGSYLFSLIKFHYKDRIAAYEYLIEYDKKVLRRLVKRSGLGVRCKIKTVLFLFSPKLESNVRRLTYIKNGMIVNGSKSR